MNTFASLKNGVRRGRALLLALTVASIVAANLPAKSAHANLVPNCWRNGQYHVLVAGSSWAGDWANRGDLNVYDNAGCFPGNWGAVGAYGLQWQCTELAERWADVRWGEGGDGNWRKTGWDGNAYKMYDFGPQLPIPLSQYPNGGSTPPQFGDILVFDATPGDSTGHVAVVVGVSGGSLIFVGENQGQGQQSTPISGTSVSAWSGLPVRGWLRGSLGSSGATHGVALLPDASGGYILDAAGGLHPFGTAPWLPVTGYWPGQDIARGIVLRSDGVSGYVLDGYGGLSPFGGAPRVSITSYWPGWDIARGIVLRSDGVSGYVLDGWGGLSPFGGAPRVSGNAYWQGWDIARGIVLRSDGVSGYVLDGWGGINPFGGAPYFASTGYFPGHDIARGIALRPDGTGGYTGDIYRGLHQFGSAPWMSVTG